MCFPNNGQEARQVSNIGDAKADLYEGDMEGYNEKGGLDGDAKRKAEREALRKIAQERETVYGDPTAALGTFGLQNTLRIGVGKLKHSEIAGDAQSAKSAGGTPSYKPLTIAAPKLKQPGTISADPYNVKIGGR